MFRTKRRITTAYQNHTAEDLIERKIAEIQPRLKLLNEMQDLKLDKNNPRIAAEIKRERKDIQDTIEIFQREYGISLYDVIAKLGAEAIRYQILEGREKDEERLKKQGETDLIDLVDESGVLLRRLKMNEIQQKRDEIEEIRQRHGNVQFIPSFLSADKRTPHQVEKRQKASNLLTGLLNRLRARPADIPEDVEENEEVKHEKQFEPEVGAYDRLNALLDQPLQNLDLMNQIIEQAAEAREREEISEEEFNNLKDKADQIALALEKKEEVKVPVEQQMQQVKKKPAKAVEIQLPRDQPVQQPFFEYSEKHAKDEQKTAINNAFNLIDQPNKLEVQMSGILGQEKKALAEVQESIKELDMGESEGKANTLTTRGLNFLPSATQAKEIIAIIRKSNLSPSAKIYTQVGVMLDYNQILKQAHQAPIKFNKNNFIETVDHFISKKRGRPKKQE